MLRCVNDGATAIKPGHHTSGNARVVWSEESSCTLFPTSGRVRFCDGLGSNIMVLVLLLPF
jgi:hypothetical protein